MDDGSHLVFSQADSLLQHVLQIASVAHLSDDTECEVVLHIAVGLKYLLTNLQSVLTAQTLALPCLKPEQAVSWNHTWQNTTG